VYLLYFLKIKLTLWEGGSGLTIFYKYNKYNILKCMSDHGAMTVEWLPCSMMKNFQWMISALHSLKLTYKDFFWCACISVTADHPQLSYYGDF